MKYKKNLVWLINRAKTISPAEIPYRLGQYIQKYHERFFVMGKTHPVGDVKTKINLVLPAKNPSKLWPNSIEIFGKEFDYNVEYIDWHLDIFSGKSFSEEFSKNLNIRIDPKLSAKNVWEINRLQFLHYIALNYYNSDSRIFLEQFMHIVDSWIDRNPYLVGINWYSNIEVNIRLIVWFNCWHLLDVENNLKRDSEFKQFVEERWLPVIYQHCEYSFKNPSKYSSSNNHLISEYAGLFIASSLWEFEDSGKWNRYAKKGLENEIVRQHVAGINREEAAEYIQFITDFFLLSFIVAENSRNAFSDLYKDNLRMIFEYIYHFLDINGNFPQYGDEDDGRCLIFNREGRFNNFKSLLTSGAIIFSDPKFKSGSHGIDEKNLFLFGEDGVKKYDGIKVINCERGSAFYPQSGHFIMRNHTGSREEIYLHFDAAPLGFLSIAAHGHADALSFIMHLDGQPFFIDSGTYTYHTEPMWRNYFIGTLAHNTIRINRKNQSVIAGPTLWLEHYNTRVLSKESTIEFDEVSATHTGYKKMGITHTRRIRFNKRENTITINDSIQSETNVGYLIEMPFHLYPGISIESNARNSFLLKQRIGRSATIQVDNNLNSEIIKGQISPEPLGWYSRSFQVKEPCNTIYNKVLTSGNSVFETRILINPL